MTGEEQNKPNMPVFVVSEECGKAINEALQRSSYNKSTGSNELAQTLNQISDSAIIESLMEVHPACPREDFKVPSGPYQIKGEGKGPARK
jgi:hypothetical protein